MRNDRIGEAMPEIKALCDEGKGHSASNFSVGVNIFMAVNRYLAKIMNGFPQYSPRMEETHHIHKLDHPSGTAITLAEEIIRENSRISGWCEPENTPDRKCSPFRATRMVTYWRLTIYAVVKCQGIHTIEWDSPVDSITISHSAKTREGFALGAVIAAEWLADRKGFHTIGEVFNF